MQAYDYALAYDDASHLRSATRSQTIKGFLITQSAMQNAADRAEKILCWRIGETFFRLITAQIGTLLKEIPSLTRNNSNNAPALVKSTNLLDFCTCFHRLIGRNVSFN
jgi:hypothetical protein